MTMSNNNDDIEQTSPPARGAYEAPAIEEIITTTELEREVHYAGQFSGPK